MNRLRESPKLALQARWSLAAAYAVAGKQEIAERGDEKPQSQD